MMFKVFSQVAFQKLWVGAILGGSLLVGLVRDASAQQTGEARSVFAADYQKKLAAVVGSNNEVQWTIGIRDIHDVQHLSDGHWLLQTSFGNVVEVDEVFSKSLKIYGAIFRITAASGSPFDFPKRSLNQSEIENTL